MELEIWRPTTQSVAIARLRRGFEIQADGGPEIGPIYGRRGGPGEGLTSRM